MDNVRVMLGEGETLLERLLDEGIDIGHDCEGTLACASCRVVVLEGLERLTLASADEVDMLDRAGADAPGARLACQVQGAGEVLIGFPVHAAPLEAASLAVSVTARAARHLAAQLAKHPAALAVRLAVEPSGCSGLRYRVDAAERVLPDDTVFDRDGIRLLVDAKSLPYLQGSRLDIVREGLSQRLRFDNPNARQSCGCGESFSA
jgi:iron-sulfur cluster assembly protein